MKLFPVFQIIAVIFACFLCYQGYHLIRSAYKIQAAIGSVRFDLDPKVDTAKIKLQKENLALVKEVFDKTSSFVKDANSSALYYFLVASGLLILTFLLPNIQTLNIGSSGVNLTLRELKTDIEKLKDDNNSKVRVDYRISEQSLSSTTKSDALKTKVVNNDPQKGMWGGKNESNNRKLTAKFEQISTNSCRIFLKVESTDSNFPLEGFVKFHLHNTFSNPNPIIFIQNGIAELTLIAWGGFTVGVEADAGKTKLELDLATLADAPEIIKTR